MAGRLPGSSSRHLGKKRGRKRRREEGEGEEGEGRRGKERRRRGGGVITHKEEEESATYFFRAAMAAISCSLSACVVPKYCQPCARVCTCVTDCRRVQHHTSFFIPSPLPPSLPPSFLISLYIP